ncbi:MAG: ABC transporter ATP-binding protein [Kiritimatiellia bacterium]|jgi:ABC-2 type transport system ATP-binding protein|nr:ABC transporter ATP-binding protein [Kiritimatiellia bacterium]
MLEIDHISFSYGRRRVIDDLSFDVAPGEIVALTGANGAGKTTLLQILANLRMQDTGSIRLDGVDPLERPIRYRRGIGYLSELCPLYEEMTVEAYLTYRVRLKGERTLRVRKRVSEALELCGLEKAGREPVRLLSQGYRKRLSLADALALHPKVVLLDDPLAGLDARLRRQIGTVLSAISSRSAVVAAGHEIRDMLGWCTRVVLLRTDGSVLFYRTGEHSREELAEQVGRQVAADAGEEGACVPST